MQQYSLKELEHYMRFSAKIVALHGDAYLPIFERFEAEVEAARKREAARQRAIKLAGGS